MKRLLPLLLCLACGTWLGCGGSPRDAARPPTATRHVELRPDLETGAEPATAIEPVTPSNDDPPEILPAVATEPEATPEPPRATETVAPSGARPILVRARAQAADTSRTYTASSAAKPPEDFWTVNVLYGTDRLARRRPGTAWTEHFERLIPGLFATIAAVLCGFVASRNHRSAWWGLTAAIGFVAFVFEGLGVYTTMSVIRLADHDGPLYTSHRNQRLQVGECVVTIPKSHDRGTVETPHVYYFQIRDNPSKHVVLHRTVPLTDATFRSRLKLRVAESPQRDLFVFIHGFNVTFEEAALRTAQMAKDLDFTGVPVFFSWPAHDQFLATYLADEDHVNCTTPHLKQFLMEIAAESGAESIHLVAHSMGNRALTATLRELELEFKDRAKLFDEVVFAAPDVFSEQFRDVLAPNLTRTANHFTLYASKRDYALAMSQLVHRGPRAGDAGDGLVIAKSIDTIDVSKVKCDPFGHSYYGEGDAVLGDLRMLITHERRPERRPWLVPADREDGQPLWVLEPAKFEEARTLLYERR